MKLLAIKLVTNIETVIIALRNILEVNAGVYDFKSSYQKQWLLDFGLKIRTDWLLKQTLKSKKANISPTSGCSKDEHPKKLVLIMTSNNSKLLPDFYLTHFYPLTEDQSNTKTDLTTVSKEGLSRYQTQLIPCARWVQCQNRLQPQRNCKSNADALMKHHPTWYKLTDLCLMSEVVLVKMLLPPHQQNHPENNLETWQYKITSTQRNLSTTAAWVWESRIYAQG